MRNIVNVLTIAISAIIVSACAIEPEEAAKDQTQNGEGEVLGTTEQASTVQGCPDGYVCIYPENAGWNNGNPSSFYFFYGTYNLSNQLNTHIIYNHQTGAAKVQLCNQYNGGDCWFTADPGTAWSVNFTPINSIVLTP